MTFDTLATIASHSAVTIALVAQAIIVLIAGGNLINKRDRKNHRILFVLACMALLVGVLVEIVLIETDLLGKSARELSLIILASVMIFVTFSMNQWLNQLDKE